MFTFEESRNPWHFRAARENKNERVYMCAAGEGQDWHQCLRTSGKEVLKISRPESIGVIEKGRRLRGRSTIDGAGHADTWLELRFSETMSLPRCPLLRFLSCLFSRRIGLFPRFRAEGEDKMTEQSAELEFLRLCSIWVLIQASFPLSLCFIRQYHEVGSHTCFVQSAPCKAVPRRCYHSSMRVCRI
jgi:hypothetical protein